MAYEMRISDWSSDVCSSDLVCLWYDHDAEEAAKLYAATFPDTRINRVQAAPGDYPDGQKGKTLMVEMTIMGIPTLLLNGGPTFPQSENFSFQVMTEDQEETDRKSTRLNSSH